MVKKFDFPSYEKWKDNEFGITRKLGDYYAGISGYRWDIRFHKFQAAISTNSAPLNIHCVPIISAPSLYFDDVTENETKLKEWYEKTVDYLNAEFEKYLMDKYFE